MFNRLWVFAIVIFLAVAGICIAVAAGQRHAPKEETKISAATPVANYGIQASDIENAVNDTRVSKGLAILGGNDQLRDSANSRASWLCAHDVWSHGGWEASLTYDYFKAGENLEYGGGNQSVKDIIELWVDSPTHYSNMTDPTFTEQGIGFKYCPLYQGRANRMIVVNHLGTKGEYAVPGKE